ncbi:MAG: winged helix-turn-helix transcriptional regulator [Thermomicrobiales bacterium]
MPQPNVFDPNCGSRRVLELIADKWTAIVVYSLARGSCRFGQLQRDVGGISHKVLTTTLRELERDGLVQRTVYPVVPPHVEYSLTSLGETLTVPLGAICLWAETHLAEVDAARAAEPDEPISPPDVQTVDLAAYAARST